MARSIFESERRLAGLAVEQYAQLKDYKARLQWGYKILQEEVQRKEEAGEIEKVKIQPVRHAAPVHEPAAAARRRARGESGYMSCDVNMWQVARSMMKDGVLDQAQSVFKKTFGGEDSAASSSPGAAAGGSQEGGFPSLPKIPNPLEGFKNPFG